MAIKVVLLVIALGTTILTCGSPLSVAVENHDDVPYLLRLVDDWLKKPIEFTRRAALDAGMDDPDKGAFAWAALAAGWSGGSLSPNPEHPVPPPPHLTGHAVNVGLTLLVAGLPMARQVGGMEDLVGDAVALLRRGGS